MSAAIPLSPIVSRTLRDAEAEEVGVGNDQGALDTELREVESSLL